MLSHHNRLLGLAGPLILSNLTVALQGMVDTAVVGHLDTPAYIGAVAVAGVIFSFLYWGLGFLRMGTVGIVAQLEGDENPDRIRSALLHSCFLAIFLALGILVLQTPVVTIGLNLVGGTPDVRSNAEVYFYWAVWGAPAVLLNMTCIGWLLGMQNARATFYVTVLIGVMNIVLDFVFVFGLHLDVRGVALASVIAQFCGSILAALFIHGELKRHPGRWRKAVILDRQDFTALLLLNQNIFIRTMCLIFAFAFFTRQGANQGELVLAANAILLNFMLLVALGLDGFAQAAEALVGRSVGTRDREQLRGAVRATMAWGGGVALLYSLLFIGAGNGLVNLMTDIETVRETAYLFLPWMIAAPVISVWCFLLDGIFIGATRGRELRNAMLFSTFIVYLPCWYLLQGLGNHGLWLALMAFFIARALSLLWYYRAASNWIDQN
ncbi:MAG: MATE family efflux transporter [Gammaproteobacteria bacterium]|nr:MATE family efflux transporter [Gammaproteobacteria bacterium]MDE0284411.1 MATE family efflux transporter [Gammaproteobacteria bacterium]